MLDEPVARRTRRRRQAMRRARSPLPIRTVRPRPPGASRLARRRSRGRSIILYRAGAGRRSGRRCASTSFSGSAPPRACSRMPPRRPPRVRCSTGSPSALARARSRRAGGISRRRLDLDGTSRRGRMTLIVHHLNNSRSQRILWMLEELGLPYEIKRYQRDEKTMLAPPELKRVHPLGKSPVLEDTDAGQIDRRDRRDRRISGREGRRQARAARAPRRRAALSPVPALCRRIDDAAAAGDARRQPHPAARQVRRQAHPADDRRPSRLCRKRTRQARLVRRRRDDRRRHHDELPARSGASRAGLDASRPATIAWLDKIHARPAYQAALAKGGPYAYA